MFLARKSFHRHHLALELSYHLALWFTLSQIALLALRL